MRNIIKKILKGSIKKINNLRLWYRLVIKEHNNYKLSFYHKLRAIKYGFSSDFYHMYHLEKNNPKDYISEYKRVLSRNINDKYKIVYHKQDYKIKNLELPKEYYIVFPSASTKLKRWPIQRYAEII